MTTYTDIQLVNISEVVETRSLVEERTVRKGVELRGLGLASVDSRQTGESVDTIDVHSARSTNSLSARSSESQGRVEVILDFDLLRRQTSGVKPTVIPL